MLLQRLRVALPRIAAGAAMATPLALAAHHCRLNQAVHCEADDDTKLLFDKVTSNYGQYGKPFMDLVRTADRIHLEPGEYLFKRGDPATHFYLILSGELNMLEEVGGREKHVDTLGPGGLCGEIALLEQKETRIRSSAAHEKTEVLAISKVNFEKMLHETNSHIRVDSSTGARILAFINMVCPVTPRTVRRNEVLFKQGDTTPACLYIVNSGTLDVFEKDRYRKDVKVESLREGECFGYISLLNSDVHARKSYTIKCSTAASELFVIDGEDFHRLMDHSRVVSALMENLTRKRRDHAQEAMFHARVARFKGW